MVLFTHNVRKIEGATHKMCDVDGACKRALFVKSKVRAFWAMPVCEVINCVKMANIILCSSGNHSVIARHSKTWIFPTELREHATFNFVESL